MKRKNNIITNKILKYNTLINKELEVSDSELIYFIINNKNIITYTNDNLLDLCSYKAYELEFKSFDKLDCEDLYIPSLKDIIKRVKKDKSPYFGRLNIENKSFDKICLKSIFIPIYNAKEELYEYICFAKKYTDEKKLSLKENKKSSLFDINKYLNDNINMIVRIDLNKNITYANKLFYERNSYKKEDLENKPYFNILENINEKNEIKNFFNRASDSSVYKTIIKKNYNNEIKQYSALFFSILDNSGKITEYVNIMYDLKRSNSED